MHIRNWWTRDTHFTNIFRIIWIQMEIIQAGLISSWIMPLSLFEFVPLYALMLSSRARWNQTKRIWKSDNGLGNEGFQSALFYKEVGRGIGSRCHDSVIDFQPWRHIFIKLHSFFHGIRLWMKHFTNIFRIIWIQMEIIQAGRQRFQTMCQLNWIFRDWPM